MTKPTLRQRLRCAFDNTMARGTSALVVWLVVAFDSDDRVIVLAKD